MTIRPNPGSSLGSTPDNEPCMMPKIGPGLATCKEKSPTQYTISMTPNTVEYMVYNISIKLYLS